MVGNWRIQVLRMKLLFFGFPAYVLLGPVAAASCILGLVSEFSDVAAGKLREFCEYVSPKLAPVDGRAHNVLKELNREWQEIRTQEVGRLHK